MAYDALLVVGVLVQAIAAVLLAIIAKANADSARAMQASAAKQAEAAQGQAGVARLSFLIDFAGQQLTAAEALREEAYDLGLDGEALELERTETAWFDMGLDAPEVTVEANLRRLLKANHAASKAIRDKEHAERRRLSHQAGAEE